MATYSGFVVWEAMPVLDINPDGPPEMEITNIVARMLFHDSPHDAKAYFYKHWLLNCNQFRGTEPSDIVNLPAHVIRTLVCGPSLDELESKKAIRLRQGYTAGCVLLSLRIFSELKFPVTLSRAIRVLERAEASGESKIEGVQIYYDRPKILESWRCMRPVAHFFAAHAAMCGQVAKQEIPPDLATTDNMLQLAASILAWATTNNFHKKSHDGIIVDPDSAWSFPEKYKPFDLGPFDRTRLPPWMLSAIETYRHQ